MGGKAMIAVPHCLHLEFTIKVPRSQVGLLLFSAILLVLSSIVEYMLHTASVPSYIASPCAEYRNCVTIPRSGSSTKLTLPLLSRVSPPPRHLECPTLAVPCLKSPTSFFLIHGAFSLLPACFAKLQNQTRQEEEGVDDSKNLLSKVLKTKSVSVATARVSPL